MAFTSPSWVPRISCDIPDSIPVGQFALERAARPSSNDEEALFVDAISGKSYSLETLQQRIEWLARALARNLGWVPDKQSPWDKVIAIFSLNTIEYFVLCWAIHRLNGICLLIHPTSSVSEIAAHMSKARCQTIFTSETLITPSVAVAQQLSIPLDRVYIIPLPENYLPQPESISKFKTLDQLVLEGSQLEPLAPLEWEAGQGKFQVAYLCPTSGTSGKQKLAMLTHYGVITNLVQWDTFESLATVSRPLVATGAIPFSHSYGVLVGHMAAWRGDSLIVFPRFDLELMLEAIPDYQIERLYLVPPILAALAASPFLLELYDFSSVTSVVTGAAALGRSLTEKLTALQPGWKFIHGYGLTESCILATFTSAHDIWPGSSGSLLPKFQLRLVGPDEEEITSHEEPGEIRFMSPSLFVGYLGDVESTKTAFDANGWLRTGDVGLMRKGANGAEHLFVVDRIKDMIKVKGIQVVPADIEALLLKHPAIIDAAVIGVPDESAGERPLAFVVRSPSNQCETSVETLKEIISDYVQLQLDETHWLHDRIVFLSKIPTSQSGKRLKKDLREMVPVR